MEILKQNKFTLVKSNVSLFASFLLLFSELSPAISQTLDCVKNKISPQSPMQVSTSKGETNNDPVYDSLRQFTDLDISPSDDSISTCILKSDGVRIINLNPSVGSLQLSSRVGNTDASAALRGVCAFSPDSSQVFALGSGSPDVGLDRIYPYNVSGSSLSRVQGESGDNAFIPSDLATALAVPPGKKFLVYVQNNSTSNIASIQSVEIKADNTLAKSFVGQDLANTLKGGSYLEFAKESDPQSAKFAFGAFSDLQQGIPGSGTGIGIFKTNLSSGVNFILGEFKKGVSFPDVFNTQHFVGISGLKFVKKDSSLYLFVSYFENNSDAGFGAFSYITKLALLKVNVRNEMSKTASLSLVGKPTTTVFKTQPCGDNSFHGISGPIWVNDSTLYLTDNNNENFFATYEIDWSAVDSADFNTEVISLSSSPVLTSQDSGEKNTDIVSTLSNKFVYVASSNLSDSSAKVFGFSIEQTPVSCKNFIKNLGLCELTLSSGVSTGMSGGNGSGNGSSDNDNDTGSNSGGGLNTDTGSNNINNIPTTSTSSSTSSSSTSSSSSTTSGSTSAPSSVYQPPAYQPSYQPPSYPSNTGRPTASYGSGRPTSAIPTPKPTPKPPKAKPTPTPKPGAEPAATPEAAPDITPPPIELNATETTTLTSDSSQFIDIMSLDLKGDDQTVIPPLIPYIILSQSIELATIEPADNASPTPIPSPVVQTSTQELPISSCCSCETGNLICNKGSNSFCEGGNVKCVGPGNKIISCCKSVMGVEQCNGDDPTIKCLNTVTRVVKPDDKAIEKAVKKAVVEATPPQITTSLETIGVINSGSAGVLVNLKPSITLKSKDLKNISQLIIDKDQKATLVQSANFLLSPKVLLTKLVLSSSIKPGVVTLVTVLNQGGGKKQVIAKSPVKVYDSYSFSNVGDDKAKSLPTVSKIDGKYVGESKKGGSLIRLYLYGSNFASKSVKVGSQSFRSDVNKTLTTFSFADASNVSVIRTRVLNRGKRILITLRYTGTDDLSNKAFTISTPKGHFFSEKLGVKLAAKKPVRSVILGLDDKAENADNKVEKKEEEQLDLNKLILDALKEQDSSKPDKK